MKFDCLVEMMPARRRSLNALLPLKLIAAIFVRPQDPDDIAEAVERLLDEQVSRDYRDRGIQQSRRYSWDATAQGTRLVYERALGMVRA